MGTVVACKLPHGLTINHMGQTINLNGGNVDFSPLAPAMNGALADTSTMSGGFGLTTLDEKQAEAFTDWCDRALYREGDKAKGLLEEPFQPLLNESVKAYKSEPDARKDTRAIATDVTTGFDGLDGDAEIKQATQGSPDLVNSGKDR